MTDINQVFPIEMNDKNIKTLLNCSNLLFNFLVEEESKKSEDIDWKGSKVLHKIILDVLP